MRRRGMDRYTDQDFIDMAEINNLDRRNRVANYFVNLATLISPNILEKLMEKANNLEDGILTFMDVNPDDAAREAFDVSRFCDDLLLFYGMMGKQYSAEYFVEWFNKRKLAAAGQKRVVTATQRSQTSQVIKDIWDHLPKLRATILDAYLDSEVPESLIAHRDTLETLKSNVKMILKWAELKLFERRYAYITSERPILLKNDVFWAQSKIVIQAYRDLTTDHGAKAPYAKILGLTGENINK